MTVEGCREAGPQKVFITGANGFIGRALGERYQSMGVTVTGIDLSADPARGVVAGDLAHPEGLGILLEDVDLVIHTAAVVSNTATMDLAWRTNVKATAELLRRCERAAVERFIHLSSVAVYGFDFTAEVSEDDPLRPMGNTYVDTKIAAEHIVLARHAAGELDCTIIRPTDVYGPGSRPWVVLPLEMMKAGRFVLPAHGRGIFSPVYIDDLVDAIVLAGNCEQARGQIFNIGGGSTPTCEVFFGHLSHMLGRPGVRSIGTGVAGLLAQSAGVVSRLFGKKSELGRGTIDMLSRRAGYSIEKARTRLGYSPRVDLEEGMRLTRLWAQTNGLVPPGIA